MLTLWLATGVLARPAPAAPVEPPVETPINSIIWGLPQGRYEDPLRPRERVSEAPAKRATTKQKSKAAKRALEDILQVEQVTVLTDESRRLIAQAAQAELNAQNLRVEMAELEALIARRFEQYMAFEEKRRKRNALMMALLLAT